jgi:hypothetical protein
MDQKFAESVVGAGVGLILAVAGNAAVAFIQPFAPKGSAALVIAGLLTVILFGLGSVIGIWLTRLVAKRLPARLQENCRERATN